jgi:phosphopantothenoylcysteine decarboxylase / phosphopantothenate---cysteine ligase
VYLKEITGTLGSELVGKRIAHCVTASVSITEAPRIARLLMRHGAEVIPVLTPKACEFVSPAIFEWSTGNPPITKLTGKVEHVELVSSESSRKADLILIAPCTANTIAKISSGLCDDPVSTLVCTALGTKTPILIASAMHEPMTKNPIIQEAQTKLEKAGVKFIAGRILESKSKLASPEDILRAVISEFGKLESIAGSRKEPLANVGLIITAGPTREPIDEVRFITNASTGKMGVALAEEARSMGAKKICLIHGPGVAIPDELMRHYEKVSIESVTTSEEMLEAVLSKLSGGEYNALISAGAPADYTNLSPSPGKISTSEKPTIKLELTASKKIISIAKENFPKTFVVAFKAEHGLEKSPKAMNRSGADMVVVNDVSRADIGFGSDFNEVFVLTKHGKKKSLPRASKHEIANKILDILADEIHPSQ